MAALRAAERAAKGEIQPWRPASGPPYSCRVRTRRRQLYLPRAERQGRRWLSPCELEFFGDDLLEVMHQVTSY
jgi:hypothetical protein